jgi:hypothetical protein
MPFAQCPNCKTEVLGSLLICPSCGASLAGIVRYEKMPVGVTPQTETEERALEAPKLARAFPDPSVLNQVRIESSFKSGAAWFFWIAGLSMINSMIYRFGGSITFIFGLGLSQVIDVFASAFAKEIPEIALAIQVVAIAMNLAILGVFAVLGILAYRRKPWAFIAGMIIYALDSLIAFAFKDYIAFAFHLLVLYGLYRGLKSLRKLQQLDKPAHGH